eukprot:2221702-Heterocapsa_arctica.AAC.1
MPSTLMFEEFARSRIQLQAALPTGAAPSLTASAAAVTMRVAKESAADLASRCGSWLRAL